MTNETSTTDLGIYKGFKIKKTKIIVNKLGDGLSKAVGVEPIIVKAGEDAFLAVRVRKTKDRYEYVTNDEGKITSVELVQIFDATGATFTDDSAREVIQVVVDAIIEKEELEKNGQMSLGIPNDLSDLDDE
jgi:hypothetical protein